MSEATHDIEAMQDRIDHAKAIAFEDGREHVYQRFEEGAGIPGHLPEGGVFEVCLESPHFHITLMRDTGDPSVGIQPWECFVVTPNPQVQAMFEANVACLSFPDPLAAARGIEALVKAARRVLPLMADPSSAPPNANIEAVEASRDIRTALAPFGGG